MTDIGGRMGGGGWWQGWIGIYAYPQQFHRIVYIENKKLLTNSAILNAPAGFSLSRFSGQKVAKLLI